MMQPNQVKRRRLDDRELLHELEKVNTNSGRSGSMATTPTSGAGHKRKSAGPSPAPRQQQKEQSVYAPLPASVVDELGLARGNKPDVSELVLSMVAKGTNTSKIWTQKVKDKTVMLDNVKERISVARRGERRLERQREKKQAKVIKAKEQREKNMFKIPEDARKYEMYIPLHTMWNEYIKSIAHTATGPALTAKLLKADLHGCCLKVTRSKCPSLIGLEGIVLLETEQTFQIITPENRLRVVPKANNVFTFVVSGQVVTLYGNNFAYRSSDRSARKFKSKPSVEL